MSRVSLYPVLTIALVSLALSGCNHSAEAKHEHHHKVVATSPCAKDVVVTQPYVCQIHSSRHIEIRALESGYLEEIPIREGQFIKQGEVMFRILPTLYQAKLAAEEAEAQLAQIKYDNTVRLFEKKVVAEPEVLLSQAELNKAKAKVTLAKAELNFATLKAPFDGIIDMQKLQQGSLISEGDKLTTLSDNSTMWVYFYVPEARYYEYKENPDKDSIKVELVLANGKKFPYPGKIAAIEGDFNNETGNIPFRADFPNPDLLLRHGQTGTILLSSTVKNATVIPQRATFEILAKKYVYIIDNEAPKSEKKSKDEHGATSHATADEAPRQHQGPIQLVSNTTTASEQLGEHSAPSGNLQHGYARQCEITILNELEDIYLIKSGVAVQDKIVLEGVREVRAGEQLEYEFLESEKSLKNLKHHAE